MMNIFKKIDYQMENFNRYLKTIRNQRNGKFKTERLNLRTQNMDLIDQIQLKRRLMNWK